MTVYKPQNPNGCRSSGVYITKIDGLLFSEETPLDSWFSVNLQITTLSRLKNAKFNLLVQN